jgi:hypothetical protein
LLQSASEEVGLNNHGIAAVGKSSHDSDDTANQKQQGEFLRMDIDERSIEEQDNKALSFTLAQKNETDTSCDIATDAKPSVVEDIALGGSGVKTLASSGDVQQAAGDETGQEQRASGREGPTILRDKESVSGRETHITGGRSQWQSRATREWTINHVRWLCCC